MSSALRCTACPVVPDFKHLLRTNGYAFLPGHAAGACAETVARALGEPLLPWKECTVVQELVPQASATPNTYSGLFGFECFPYHTDLAHYRIPPRYLMLRCSRGYADVPTLLIDGNDIVIEVGPTHMERALVKPRRPQSGKMQMMRLRQLGGDAYILRWDQTYLRPASKMGELASGRAQAAIERATPTAVVMTEDGDVVVIDNWRMLHSRPAVPDRCRGRSLERVYLGNLK